MIVPPVTRLRARFSPRLSTFLSVGLLAFFLTGCGGGGGGSTGFAPVPVVTATGTTPSNSTTPGPAVGNVIVSAKAPTNVVARGAERDWLGALLSLFSPPAQAQGVALTALPSATVVVLSSIGAFVTTGVTDITGAAVFSGLTPGTYTFIVSKTTSAGFVQLAAVGVVTSGSTLNLNINPTTTALTYVIRSQSTNGDITGTDTGAFDSLTNGSNTDFNQLLNNITTQIQTGQGLFDTNNGGLLNSALATQANATGQTLFLVVFRYPAPNQVGVKRSGPMVVAFNKPVKQAQIPPTYTDWTVTHQRVTTGQTITINNSNFTQYGTWSYSDSPQTINGVAIPPHALAFTLGAQQMSANAREVFQWRFGAVPQATDNTFLTLAPGESSGTFLDLVFYTGND